MNWKNKIVKHKKKILIYYKNFSVSISGEGLFLFFDDFPYVNRFLISFLEYLNEICCNLKIFINN